MKINSLEASGETPVAQEQTESTWKVVWDITLYALSVFSDLYAKPVQTKLIGNETSDHKVVCYGNGIWTSYEKAIDDAGYVSKLMGDRGVHLIYFPDRPHKLVECGLLKTGMQTETTHAVAEFFEELVAKDPLVEILWVYHSGSGLVGRNVLQILPPEVQSRISTYGVAPATIISSPHIKEAGVLMSPMDLVPLTGAADLYPERDKIEFTTVQSWDPLKEHEFRNPAFETPLKNRLDDFIETI